MWRMRAGLVAAVAIAALGGCASRPKDQAPTVNESMREVMEPMAEKIWAYSSQAYNDVGDGLVASKLSDGDWKGLGEAAARLKERAAYFATAERAIVARDGQPILGSQAVGQKGRIGTAWDAVNAQTVQARIDADAGNFRAHAKVLADAADAIGRAAMTKDAALLYKVSSGMDEVCDGCHEPYWGTDEPPAFPKDGAR